MSDETLRSYRPKYMAILYMASSKRERHIHGVTQSADDLLARQAMSDEFDLLIGMPE